MESIIKIHDTGQNLSGVLMKDVAPDVELFNTRLSYTLNCEVDSQSELLNFRLVSGDSDQDAQKRQFEIPHAEVVSLKSPTVIIVGVLDEQSSNDMVKLATLNRLAKTQGVKEVSGSALLSYLDYWENGEQPSSSVRAVIKNVSFIRDNTSLNRISYQITLLMVK